MIEKLKKLDNHGGLGMLLGQISEGRRLINIGGLIGSSRSLISAYLFLKINRPVLHISQDNDTAEKIFDDFNAFFNDAAVYQYPSWQIKPYEIRAPHAEDIGERLRCLHAIQNEGRCLISASAASIIEPAIDPLVLRKLAIALRKGQSYDISKLTSELSNLGYIRRPIVEQLGEFAVRGGLLDVYAATYPEPIRIEFFGDELESIRSFSVLSQRSLGLLDNIVILPQREIQVNSEFIEAVSEELPQEQAVALHEALGPNGGYDGLQFFRSLFENGKYSILNYLPHDCLIVMDDPLAIENEVESINRLADERYADRRELPFGKPADIYFNFQEVKELFGKSQSVSLRGLLADSAPDISIETVPQEPTGPHIKLFAEKIDQYQMRGFSGIIFCDGETQKRRLTELISEYELALQIEPHRISSGFGLPGCGLFFISDHEIFAKTTFRKKMRRFRDGIALSSYQSLQPGDFVVHIDYGIGRYKGLETLMVDGRKRDCLLIYYSDNDKLYVPIEEFSRIQKFGGKDGSPALSKLGSGTWEKTKARAKKAIMDMANELIELYARRQALPGFAFSSDSHWEKELEASFPFDETPDQIKTIDEIKEDMQRTTPMDRLVCGDVGYGKTEVAIRAAFKAIESGKQVAVLVPTTILAQQHVSTFRDRLSQFPVKVELLSRFRSPQECKEIKTGLGEGKIDIVIGTHKLLQKDIDFHNLGLLIVDEEHRFGVTHKEKIKKLKSQIDSLTLTATPIPRTLQLSLLGARDMSIINTPPRNRLPISTEVALFSDKIIREAIERELLRGGQIFFVHNRVESIEAVYRYLKRLLPAIDIIIGHGQMRERQLEKVMMEFLQRKYQVLLATTIIESGLDIPTVNTIIINRADKLGLAQLYQLRGRVGRADRKAYAYLLVPPLKMLTEKARKRLRAIEEFTELGSGFHLAMRDLEIRGAGNILGAQQHGFIEEVGFDLYCRLLEEAVAEIKNHGIPPPKREIRIQTDLDLFIPESFIADSNLRVEIYRSISMFDSVERLNNYAGELKDRFGSFPQAVSNLLNLAAARILGLQLGAEKLLFKKGLLALEFPQSRSFNKDEITDWRKRYAGHLEFKSYEGLKLSARLQDDTSDSLKNVLQLLAG